MANKAGSPAGAAEYAVAAAIAIPDAEPANGKLRRDTFKTILSKTYGQLGGSGGTPEFGHRWQDSFCEMHGVLITTRDGRLAKVCALGDRGGVEFEAASALVSSQGRHVFFLRDDEHIEKVGLYRDGSVIIGLRINTNLRWFPWIGRKGDDVQIVQAPAGYYICGFFSQKGDSAGDNELGFRFGDMLRPSRANPVQYLLTEYQKPSLVWTDPNKKGAAAEFLFWHEDLQAVVLACNTNGVQGVRILTSGQLSCYTDEESLWLQDDQMFLLVPGERIRSVEVGLVTEPYIDLRNHYRYCIGMRFKTSAALQPFSPWFGCIPNRNVVKLESPFGDGGHICGFFGSLTASGDLSSFGAVFQQEPTKLDAVPKETGKEVSMDLATAQ